MQASLYACIYLATYSKLPTTPGRLYEYYRDDGQLYLVEEYCSGGTLDQRLSQRGGKLSVEECAVYLRQVRDVGDPLCGASYLNLNLNACWPPVSKTLTRSRRAVPRSR